MNSLDSIGTYLWTSLLAGIVGVAAMEMAMWLVTRRGLVHGSMVVAVGSLFTRSRHNAFFTGAIVHVLSAVVFAMLYVLAMVKLGFTGFPSAIIAGVVISTIHGIIVSLMLVWVIADHHPLAEFTDASFSVGLNHVLGHIAYGAAVGLVVALSPL